MLPNAAGILAYPFRPTLTRIRIMPAPAGLLKGNISNGVVLDIMSNAVMVE